MVAAGLRKYGWRDGLRALARTLPPAGIFLLLGLALVRGGEGVRRAAGNILTEKVPPVHLTMWWIAGLAFLVGAIILFQPTGRFRGWLADRATAGISRVSLVMAVISGMLIGLAVPMASVTHWFIGFLLVAYGVAGCLAFDRAAWLARRHIQDPSTGFESGTERRFVAGLYLIAAVGTAVRAWIGFG